jgi:UDP-N-acetylglucosamine--dolichyl-phosphate N-acetylglucosaminephosphotransferase
MYILISTLIISFLVSIVSIPVLIRKFSLAGITGVDVHKSDKPSIPEMGGLAIVAGFIAAVLFLIALVTLSTTGLIPEVVQLDSLTQILAVMTTVLIIAVIGIFDDLVSMRQSVKAILPIFASFPLVVIAAGHPYITLPFLGSLYLPFIYPLILIPLAITIFSNLTNMLAGFNGLEAGMGIVACSTLSIVAWHYGRADALIILLSMCGALLGFLYYNKYPARILPGDVGTLSIGAVIASAAIIGNFETAAVIVMIPFIIDFGIKAKNKFPKEVSSTKISNGKLSCPKVLGLPSLIMSVFGGIKETNLVAMLLGLELICGLVALSI